MAAGAATRRSGPAANVDEVDRARLGLLRRARLSNLERDVPFDELRHDGLVAGRAEDAIDSVGLVPHDAFDAGIFNISDAVLRHGEIDAVIERR